MSSMVRTIKRNILKGRLRTSKIKENWHRLMDTLEQSEQRRKCK